MKVAFAMSSGVYSSVCAYILKEQCCDVSEITLNLDKANSTSCASKRCEKCLQYVRD